MTLLLLGFVLSAFATEFETFEETEQSEVLFHTFPKKNDLDPIVLVPGLAGSRLEYKEKTGSKWEVLWLDTLRTIPLRLNSYIKDLQVTYDPTTETYRSASHIDARPVDFGGVNGVNFLDPGIHLVSGMFDKIVKALEETGYKVGETMFGAPYDWRLANAKQVKVNGMHAALKTLVETAYTRTNRKVHILGHSCGCIFTHTFLTEYVPAAWRDKYIASFISTSGPYGGAAEALGHLMSPRKWAIPTISAEKTHELVENFGGIYWMLPNTNAYPNDYVLASVPSRKQVFTVANYSLAFSSTGRTLKQQGIEMTQRNINNGLPAPQVPVHLIYSYNESTTQTIVYDGPADSWWKHGGKDISGDGDGTVPLRSLIAPVNKWPSQQKQPVKVTALKGLSHTKILDDQTYLETVLAVVSRNK